LPPSGNGRNPLPGGKNKTGCPWKRKRNRKQPVSVRRVDREQLHQKR
jgi:hypothetical protein